MGIAALWWNEKLITELYLKTCLIKSHKARDVPEVERLEHWHEYDFLLNLN